MPFADLADTRLHYRFDGTPDAPVLVLSNSLGTTLSMWDAQVGDFARRFRVLRYDARGHGASSVTPGPYTIAQLGRDAADLLDALDLARVRFCGLSLGGMVGQWIAASAPSRVDRLVLCNTAARIPVREAYDARIAAVRQGGMAAVTGAVLERWFTADFRTRAPDKVAPVRDLLLACPPDGYIAACAAVRDMDLRDEASRIAAPTLVIAGAHDVATPPAEGRFLAGAIGGARYVELDAAHLSNVESGAEA